MRTTIISSRAGWSRTAGRHISNTTRKRKSKRPSKTMQNFSSNAFGGHEVTGGVISQP
ncbi:hypothetical protein EMPG_12782 [Blastomyces silverae]|uniref:Uncharacterized protein n=1 Tax=Blastomyces silverae TaxID=2060906 RepID=A0A0H1BL88_9EURO|nr:hypothetical protein EMPG_12782 [Blastomyces silverae]